MFCSFSSLFVPNTNQAVFSSLSCALMVSVFFELSVVRLLTSVLRFAMLSSSSEMCMSLASSSARNCCICWFFSSSCIVRFSIAFLNCSPLNELSLSCWRNLFINCRFCAIVCCINCMFSRMRCCLLAPSPSLAMLTRFSASAISLKPSSISFIVDIMSLISLSFCAMICVNESRCCTSAESFFAFSCLQATMAAMHKPNNISFFIYIILFVIFLFLFHCLPPSPLFHLLARWR